MDQNSSARWVNIVAGVWLFISAFVWSHTPAQLGNTWSIGLLTVFFAAAATRSPQLRWANAALAVWLFGSVWALPTHSGTFWNNLIVSIVMFLAAITPSSGGTAQTTRPAMTGSPRTPTTSPEVGAMGGTPNRIDRPSRDARH